MQTGKGNGGEAPANRDHVIANRPADPNWLGIGSESDPQGLVEPSDKERRDTSHKTGENDGEQND